MTKKGLLSISLALTATLSQARGQSPPAAPPATAPVAGIAGSGQTQTEALPVVDSAPVAGSGLFPACDGGCSNIWTRPTLTGDWFGHRPRLAEKGITFGGDITQFAFGLDGGINTPRIPPILGQGNNFSYTGRGNYNVTFDLEKFGGLPHGKLVIGAQHWWGQYGNVSLNTGALSPAIFPAALPPVPNNQGTPYITDFFITQPLSKKWVVFAGKKNVIGAADQDDFAGGNGTVQFMNQAFIANPAFLLALPYTSFTAGVASPREWGGFSTFIYDPQNRTQDFFRLDDLFSKGIIAGGEVRLKTNFLSLPGEHHVGGMWKHLSLTNLAFNEPPPGQYPYMPVAGSPTLNDSYTVYYGFDQYFKVYSADSKKGWGMFGRASISDGNPTPIRYFLSLGIGGYSPFRSRQGDQFGIGWYYLGASDDFGPRPRAIFGPRDGTGVEVFYNFKITPWMNLTPDFQILRPEAGAIADTAYIGGLRLNLTF